MNNYPDGINQNDPSMPWNAEDCPSKAAVEDFERYAGGAQNTATETAIAMLLETSCDLPNDVALTIAAALIGFRADGAPEKLRKIGDALTDGLEDELDSMITEELAMRVDNGD